MAKISFRKFHKSFKIGEDAYHGIWRLEGEGQKLVVKGIDDQTLEVRETREFDTNQPDFWMELEIYLSDMSTPYRAEKIIKHARKRIKKGA